MITFQGIQSYPSLAIFSADSGSEHPGTESTAKYDNALPDLSEILKLFELATGWVVEVVHPAQRSAEPKKFQNKHNDRDNLLRQTPALGELRIVDMSPLWPAGRPTGSRSKCDRLIVLLNDLFTDLIDHRVALQNAKSILAGFEQHLASSDLDEELTDSFIPRYPYQTATERDEEFLVVEQAEPNSSRSSDSKWKLTDSVWSPAANVATKNQTETVEQVESNPPQKTLFGSMVRWQLGGRRGYHQGRYVDWKIEEDGRITLILGQTDEVRGYDFAWPQTPQQAGSWETRLIINPASQKYWLTGDQVATFYTLNHGDGKMSPVIPGQHRINEEQSFIATPSDQIVFGGKPMRLTGCVYHPSPNFLAQLLKEALGDSIPTIVLNFR